MDNVYVLREAAKPADHEEARYSVRSLIAAGLDTGTLWFAGAGPVWAGGIPVLPVTSPYAGYRATSENLLAALRSTEVSDPFVYWNDDMFALAEGPVRVFHRGPLAVRLYARRVSSSYRSGGLHAYNHLRELGYADPIDYDLHVPLLIYKEHMLAAIGSLKAARRSEAYKRTVYGNFADLGGEYRDDVKVPGDGQVSLAADWVSTSDRSFARGWVGTYLRERFNEPSPYERIP